MPFRVLKNVSTSLLEAYVEQVFLIPLATWTPELIQQEDVPESFELFTSYSIGYGVLQFFDNNSYKYCGPMDFTEEIVEAATKADIVRYRRFIIPDWALPGKEPWVYENRRSWVSPLHFYQWKFSIYSQVHAYPIHHNFVPEDDPTRMDTGDVYPKHGVWFYLQGFTSSFPLVIPMSPAGLPVDLCPTDFGENSIVSYCILPNFVHYLSNFMRRGPRDLVGNVSAFIDYYARMQPAYIAPAGTEFTRAHVECGEYSCVVEGFWTQTRGSGLAPVAGDPRIPMEYMAPDVIRLPGVKWVIECIYKQTMARWFLHQCCSHFSSI